MKRNLMTIAIAATALMMLGCGAKMPSSVGDATGKIKDGTDTVNKTATEVENRAAEPSKACFHGETKTVDPEGKVVEQFETIFEWYTLPPAKQIVERSTYWRKGQDPQMLTVRYEVKEKDYTFKDEGGKISDGKGAFSAGDMWSWTAWSSEATMSDGSKMKQDIKLEDKAFTRTWTLIDDKDAVVGERTDTLMLVDDAKCVEVLKKFGATTLNMKATEKANDAAKEGGTKVNEAINK